MPNCSVCGSKIKNSAGRIAPEAADGFKVGRDGGACDVPHRIEHKPLPAGNWKYAWGLGNAVRRQIRGC